MARKHLALLAALLGVATPSHAFDTPNNTTQTVMFYYAIPLDAQARKDRTPWMGMQIQGKRDYQAYNVDTRLFRLAEGSGSAEATLLFVGAAALGAAALVSHRGKKSQEAVQQQQASQPASGGGSSGGSGSTPCTC